MTETSKGTLYALLSVAMFATLGTGFKMAVTRMSSFSVVVWIGIWATLTLFCLNRHLTESMPLEVTAKGFADLKVRTAHQLCDKDLTALNTKDDPERIKPAPLKDIAIRGGTVHATLAPASWSVIRLG